MFDLTGKVALVTGSARGIGLAATSALANSGAKVIAADLDADTLFKEIESLDTESGSVIGLELDVTSSKDWSFAISEIEKEYNRLDVLVNNAGFMHCGHFLETSLDDFRRSMNVNFESVVIGMQTAVPLMTKTSNDSKDGGSIINICSIYGQVAGDFSAAYCASKGAVRLLTKAAALDLARGGTNIRVNTVHPGAVNTDLARSFQSRMVENGVLAEEEAASEMVVASTPLARWGEVDDISGVITFLASGASKFMTGSEVTVDGGLTIV